MPPSEVTLKKNGKAPVTATADAAKDVKKNENEIEKEAETPEVVSSLPTDSVTSAKVDTTSSVASGDLWTPVVKELQAKDGVSDIANQSVLYIFIMGFFRWIIGAFYTMCMANYPHDR